MLQRSQKGRLDAMQPRIDSPSIRRTITVADEWYESVCVMRARNGQHITARQKTQISQRLISGLVKDSLLLTPRVAAVHCSQDCLRQA